ncbi:MAG: hypothetical protein OEW90_01850 [Betaproteobacteria bacterium]|nr:hypothetical protein [Betaproteobacteria bacterium]MDH4322863.1 hypothetical protein [Betaproteobacteria bacterium]MDH5210093.1 hypothetical protein [Betaproteobacteria bacterium]
MSLSRLPDEFVQSLLDNLDTKGKVYARRKAERTGLEEERKITKNELMNVAEAEDVRTITKQERFAYSHPTYRAIVTRLIKAVEEEALAEYELKLIDMQFEAWRTINANERAASR